MTGENELIGKLKSEGYKEVYIWKDGPEEFYAMHAHPYQTKLIILDGNMKMKLGTKNLNLKKGDIVIIKANEEHEATIGPNGCTYLVGEEKNE